MIIRNAFLIDLGNEKLFIIKRSTRRTLLQAVVDDGSSELETFWVPRITFKFCFHGVNVRRRQFPILVAFARTGHKSPGQRLRTAVFDLRSFHSFLQDS